MKEKVAKMEHGLFLCSSRRQKMLMGYKGSCLIISSRAAMTMMLFVFFLIFAQRVDCNPLPKQDGVAASANRFQSSVQLLVPSSSVSAVAGASSSVSEQQQDRLLAKPSQLTFKIGRCEADVSLEYIICRNLRKRGDLPKKQPYFDDFQHAIFVSISGEETGDIRMEDFKSLFPNLVALSITDSPGSAASLINLEKTGTASKWRTRESLVPKSLLQDPHFAKRLNLNQFSSSSGLLQKLTTQAADARGRGGRALISQEPPNHNNKLYDTTSLSTSTTTDAAAGADDDHPSGSWPEGDYLNDDGIPSQETNDIFSPNDPELKETDGYNGNVVGGGSGDGGDDGKGSEADIQADMQMDDGSVVVAGGAAAIPLPETPHKLLRLVWPSIKMLNISNNRLTSDSLPDFLGNIFPNLEKLYLSDNDLTTLDRVREADWTSLQSIDISGNPLDCTNLQWIEGANINLLQENETLCDQPPHQNRAKPILKVLHLLKKVREECRVNCSCDIAYIWEVKDVVHSKTVVNCSGKGFLDFPNPQDLPKPTDTLDLRNNKITSMSTFVDDHRYLDLNVMNLHLDDNQISSINLLEGSDWFYQFQVFSIRRNDLTEVPVYVLENVFRQNPRLLQIDLSSNKFKCDCFTVSSFKVWLLKYSNQIGHIEDVRCDSTNEQIRYLKMEQWCQMDNGTQYIDVLDMVSIVLAILIVAVVSKVYYDYWNFKTKGKLPWLVGKM